MMEKKPLPYYEINNELDKILKLNETQILPRHHLEAIHIIQSYEQVDELNKDIIEETRIEKLKEFINKFKKQQAEDNLNEIKESIKDINFLANESPEVNQKITYINAEQLLQLDIPEIEWFVQRTIPKRGVTIIGGDSGSLKSFMSLHLACCMSSQKQFLNQFKINCEKENQDVVYIDEENRINTLKKRINLLKGGMPETDFSKVKLIIESGLKLDEPTERKLLIENIKERGYKPQLIIFDSFVRFFKGDENFSGDVKKVFDEIKIIMQEFNCGIILLHHTSKNTNSSKHSLRGSGDLSAFADVVLMMEHKKQYNNYLLTQVKNRHDEEITPTKIKLEASDEYIKLEFDGYLEKEESKEESCRIDIEEWIRLNKVKEFATSICTDYLKSKGYSRTLVYRGLKQLTGTLIEKDGKGRYRVMDYEQDTLFVEEEKIQ